MLARKTQQLVTTTARRMQTLSAKIVERQIEIPLAGHTRTERTSASIRIVQVGRLAPQDAEHTVLLLPGALGSAWTDFRPQLERLPSVLPETWCVIGWDPPGYGRSTLMPAGTARDFPLDFFRRDAQAAGDLMEVLHGEANKKYSLVGWSDGGITSMILAADRPQAVDKLVVWGSNSYVLPKELLIYEGESEWGVI